MATIKFTKMHGCGNDYIYFDCMSGELNDPNELSKMLSDRHFGVGGDGIVMICESDAADAKMRMFNADGSEGKMCGNAIRCTAKYLYDRSICKKTLMTIETLSGMKIIDLKVENGKAVAATVNMGAAVLKPADIPCLLEGEKAIAVPTKIDCYEYKLTCVSMGNPHCVVFIDEDPDLIDLKKIGPMFEKNELFPEGVNTEFVEVLGDNTLKMRVWERGSGETLACGTGACAAAVAAVENGIYNKGEDIRVCLTGGSLIINYTDDRVLMTGPAVEVFSGEMEI